MPTIHNPAAVVMPQERRGAIAEIARRHGLHIIEDDIAARCMEDPPQPIAAMAPEFTIYLTGLSKTVAPGLRIGFLHSPEKLLERQASIVGALASGGFHSLGQTPRRYRHTCGNFATRRVDVPHAVRI